MVILISKGARLLPLFSTYTKMTPLLDQVMSAYGMSEKVKIKDVTKTELLLNKIVNSGTQALQVITDFDATVTRYQMNGKRCESSYGVMANSPLVSAKVKEDTWNLFDFYAPIEDDASMSMEEKTPHMLEWYKKTHDIFLSSEPPLNSSQVSQMAGTAYTFLRENADKLFLSLHTSGIPTLVLSAGMGNIVEEILKYNSVFYPNIRVMANFMQFDENGVLSGFSKPFVHTYNKNETVLHENHCEYVDIIKNRQNIILMGDNLGDTNMAAGMKNADAVLKLGFLNCEVESQLPSFMDLFDVVLIKDESMDFVNSIMKLIVKSA